MEAGEWGGGPHPEVRPAGPPTKAKMFLHVRLIHSDDKSAVVVSPPGHQGALPTAPPTEPPWPRGRGGVGSHGVISRRLSPN